MTIEMFMPRILSTFIVIDFGEDQLLFKSERIVASAVESIGVDSPEVAHPRQREVEQLVDKLVHAVAAECNLGADFHALTELEVSKQISSQRSEQPSGRLWLSVQR